MILPLTFKKFSLLSTQLLENFEAAAIVTKDGQILDLIYENLADIGTLGICGQTVQKYFPLQDGDVAILNDPGSGGTTLTHISFVTPLLKNSDWLLVSRIGFKPILKSQTSLLEEGLRVPPTPVAQSRQCNEPLLEAISTHPHAYPQFSSRIKSHLDLLWKKVDRFREALDIDSQIKSRGFAKAYLEASKKYVSQLIAEFPQGEERLEVKTLSDKTLKLRMSLERGEVTFDFSGTSNPKTFGMTDSMTFGACIGALSSFFNKQFPLNSGSFSLFNVITPTGSFLNASNTTPTLKGVYFGTNLVASSVYRCLGKLSNAFKYTSNNPPPVLLSLAFADRMFFDSLASGVSATNLSDGTDAIQVFIRNRLQNSVEMIENIYPLTILKSSLRPNSGGRGRFRGGSGMVREYLLKEPAKLYWATEPSLKFFPDHVPGNGFEILVHRKNKKTPDIIRELSGELDLQSGDRFIVATPGGFGFGKQD